MKIFNMHFHSGEFKEACCRDAKDKLDNNKNNNNNNIIFNLLGLGLAR
jgi:hypothetical protein